MRIRIITIFPGFFDSCLDEGLLGKANARGLVEVEIRDLRDFATGRHRKVDDEPFGGGAGMVMKVDVWAAAIAAARAELPGARVVLLTPQGPTLDDAAARRLARDPALVLCCGRYEGVDERVAEHLIDEELSIGDYVLTGGEAAALVTVDAVARKLPGVIGRAESVEEDTHVAGLKYPQYTRPRRFGEWEAPAVLLGGDHAAIAKWRAEQAAIRTATRRPDLVGPQTAARVRLAVFDPSPDRADDWLALQRAYGLREVAVNKKSVRRRAGEGWIHVAPAPGPGQASTAHVARILADGTGLWTVSWGGPAPREAVVAAPAWETDADRPAALVAWLDRVLGRPYKSS